MFFRHQGCFLCAIWHLETPNTLLEFFCSNCWNFSVPILSLVRLPSRGLSCLRGLFCPFWQRGFLAYFRLFGLLVCLAPGLFGMPRFWPLGLLACLTRFWPLCLLTCLVSGPWCLLACLAPDLCAFWSAGIAFLLASAGLTLLLAPAEFLFATLGLSVSSRDTRSRCFSRDARPCCLFSQHSVSQFQNWGVRICF